MALPADWSRFWAKPGLGGAPLGNLFAAISDAQAEATVDAAWAAGVRYFDTAPHYGLGLSERRLGRALAKYPRDEYLLSTKVGRLVRPNPHPQGRDDEGYDVPDTLYRVRDYSPEGVRTSLAESRERLQTDRIDIVYIHDPDEYWEPARDGAAPELTRLREAGEIGAWGAGMNQAEMLTRFVLETAPDLIMLAGRFTLLDQGAQDELLPACRDRDVAVVAVGVFNSGILATDTPGVEAHYNYAPAPVELIERAQRIAAVCQDFGITLPAAAMAFPLTEPVVVNRNLGMSSPEQVRQNLALSDTPIPTGLWDALRSKGLIR